MSRNNDKEYVETGSGLGYHSSSDVYVENEKIGSEANRTDLSGREYTDVYDNHGNKIDSYYT